MSNKKSRPFGLWDSPITPTSLSADRRLESARWDSDGRTLVWLEGCGGRGVLRAQSPGDDAPRDLTTELDVRAEVSYGGGDFTVHGGDVYFVVHKTGRLFRQAIAGGSATPITPPFGKAASPVVSPDGRWVVYVHSDPDDIDRLAIVDAHGRHWPQILESGHDFYMQPRFSPDGKRVCWIAWDHPQMPWIGTQLYLASVSRDSSDRLTLDEPRLVAGGNDVAIFQPEFVDDGRQLAYVSDESGWGRLVVEDLGSGNRRMVTPEGVEHGMPAWVQDMRTHAWASDGQSVIAVAGERGTQRVQKIRLECGTVTPISGLEQYTAVDQVFAAPQGDQLVFVGSGPRIPPRIVVHDLARERTRVVARSSGESVPTSALASCEAVTWPTADGDTAHGLYYPPASAVFESPGKPPLMVLVHGGPTSQVRAAWKADAQFFATRGYAVLMVNYRGSTGYGRNYMLKLHENWGICDVEDVVAGRQYLADAGRVDPQRTVVMGGSAGGFTVLQTMVEHPETFTAGICLYGVADQFHLAMETHKFESRYLDFLIGPLPESAQRYRERSPLQLADRIRRPLAIYQGEVDRVVPRQQSDSIVEVLKRNSVPHAYHVYAGEGHGWRKQETIEHFYRSVDSFLRQYVLFA